MGDVFRRIQIVEDLLHQMNISIKLVWVPGHVGVAGNEQSDRLAKETVKNIQMGREEVIDDISKSGAISLCSKLTVKSWQRSLDRFETGTFTRALIPNVTTKVLFPKNRNVGIMYSRMLLGDTMLKDDAFRCGLVDSPICECNQDRESIDHFLLACPVYNVQRSEMLNKIQDAWLSDMTSSTLTLSTDLLLSPIVDCDITKETNVEIKLALFDYISSTGRKF